MLAKETVALPLDDNSQKIIFQEKANGEVKKAFHPELLNQLKKDTGFLFFRTNFKRF
jgi:hypothetical protein